MKRREFSRGDSSLIYVCPSSVSKDLVVFFPNYDGELLFLFFS